MEKKLRFMMDESDAPYEKNKNPYQKTQNDNIINLKLIKKYGLELKPDSDLYKIGKELNMI